jgi:hypothetical protein
MSDQKMQSGECGQGGGPVAAHEKLAPFVGTFKARVKIWMGPGDPMVSTGVMVNTLELGGRFLQEVYQGDDSGGPFPDFAGRGYWGYNTVINKYEGFWIDTASTMMQFESGDVDASGKVWTMLGELPNPSTGQNMKKKSVITLKDNDHHSMEMFFTTPDGKEIKGMEIQYTRVK